MEVQKLFSRIGTILFIGLFAAFSFPLSVSAAAPTEASLCDGFTRLGRDGCHGYFANANFYGEYGITGYNILDCDLAARGCVDDESIDNELPNNIDSAASFESTIDYYLGSSATAGYTYNHAGAAFIIDAMLGKDGSTFGSYAAALKYAVDNYSTWETDVNYYADHGMVNWDKATTLDTGTVNSMHTCVTSYDDCTQGNINDHDGKDFAFFKNPDDEASDLIVFTNSDGTTFEIRKECANLVGTLDPLSIPTPPPITATCGSIQVDPDMPDPDTPYTITAAVDYASTADATTVKGDGDKFFIDVTGPSVAYTNADVPITQNGATFNGTASPGASHNTGTYTIKYGTTGTTGAVSCTSTLVIADQPTTTTTGGDVEAGAGMGGTACTTPADNLAGIVSWNNGGTDYTEGAGTQYAALVLNHLQGFVSGQGTSLAPSGLSFANDAGGDVNTGSGLYGGLFGSEDCVSDYFSNHPTTPTHTGDDTITTIGTGTNTMYITGGNVTIGNGGTLDVPNGSHTTIYVAGNVYIDSSIEYSNAYANVGAIPSFSIVAEGNIYIAPGVGQLDGLYVAQPTAAEADGIIYTCASAPFTAAALNGNLYDTCDVSSLTVNGSFVARQVWLLRTTGTATGASAENFDFDPETWLTTPPAVTTPGSSLGSGYDAITSLPPVL